MQLDKNSYQSQTLVASAAAAAVAEAAEASRQPNPIDLQIFLPWACRQLQAADEVLVTKVQQAEYVSSNVDKVKRRSKNEKGFSEVVQSAMAAVNSSESVRPADADKIKITAVHNAQDKCTHLKLLNNRSIPRVLLKILGLVIKFHTHLGALTINAGADALALRELARLRPRSNITELCLDGAGRPGLDFTPLLAHPNHLRNLSLARCKIDDKTVAQVAELITPPEHAGTQLKLLNLASNRFTDVGVRHLAVALRTNRTLCYLNVSDNRISDAGGAALLEVLGEFELIPEEIRAYQHRLINYLNKKLELLDKLKTKLKAAELNLPKKPKSNKYEMSIEQKAVQLLDSYLGKFDDPFSFANTVRRGGKVYCTGNSALAYLNVAYCSLHYETLRRLVRVLEAQRRRGARGLLAVSVEGNPLPCACAEYDRLLLLLAAPAQRRMSVRRRPKSSDDAKL